MSPEKTMELSVVVCVSDDMRVVKTLNSITENCQVVVVLNGSTDEVRLAVKKFYNKLDLKIIEIPERNLSKARNIGTIESKYDKVVYYDSDCVLVPGALVNFERLLEEYDLVDGCVKFLSDTKQSKVVSAMRSMGVTGMALCPAMGLNKRIIDKIGFYFDEEIQWIEDSELNRRAMKCNIPIGKIEEVTCIHDNLTYRQDLRSARRYGTGAKIATKRGLHPKRPCANWNLVSPCFKQGVRCGMYAILWNINYCLGYFFT